MFTPGWEFIGSINNSKCVLFGNTMVLYVLSPQNCQTALMLASYSGHTDVVQLLLSSGAQVDLRNKVRHIN